MSAKSGMRDGLQSIAEIMPTETEDRLARCRIRRRRARDRGQLVCAAEAPAAARRCRGGGAPCADPARAHRLGADPQPHAAPSAAWRSACHEMNFVLSVSEGHNRSNVRRSTAESVEDFRRVVALCRTAPARPAPADHLRARHRLRLHDRGRRSTKTACAASPIEVAEAGADGSSSPTRSATASRRRSSACSAGSSPMSRRCRSPAHFHDTRGLGLANVLAAFNAGCARLRRLARRARRLPLRARRDRQHRHRGPRLHVRGDGLRDRHRPRRLTAVRELVARALPDVAQHGAIAKAGLPQAISTRSRRPASIRARPPVEDRAPKSKSGSPTSHRRLRRSPVAPGRADLRPKRTGCECPRTISRTVAAMSSARCLPAAVERQACAMAAGRAAEPAHIFVHPRG